MKLQSFRSRLLLRLGLLALVAMLLTSVVQAVLITRDQRHEYDVIQAQLTSTQIPLLQAALWDIETSALRMQLERIAQLKSVAAVRLRSETGLEFIAGDPKLGGMEADVTLVVPSPMSEQQRLGVLEVFHDREQLRGLIIYSIFERVLEFSLYTLLLFLVLFRALYREIGRPLQLIAGYVGSLKPEKAVPRLELSRGHRNWYDEIDLVARGFDTLRDGITHYAERHERVIQALASQRDNLDRRVEERTAELAFLNGFLKLISGSSLKLMHLNAAEYPGAMTQRLRALGQYLQLDAGALLDGNSREDMKVRSSWIKTTENGWLESLDAKHLRDGPPGWSVTNDGHRTWLVRFVGPERTFCYAARSRSITDTSDSQREELLLGAGQWLFSVVQHWDHVVGLEQARQELVLLSSTDPLTGLANRRRFDEHQLSEVKRALRSGHPISVLMIDVDYFKGFNDLYGHAAGDDCLRALADVLHSSFKRAGELPARLGGEEFAVFLPGHDLEGAARAAEPLRQAVQALAVPHEGSLWGVVTVSIGCASWRGGGAPADVIEELMRLADARLYEAKKLGRNRVCLNAEL